MKIMKIPSKNNCFFHFFHFRAFTILACKNQQQFSEGSVLIYFSAMLIDFGPPFESFGLQNRFPSHETTLFLQFFWNNARHQGSIITMDPPRWLAYSLRATMRGGSRNISSHPACRIQLSWQTDFLGKTTELCSFKVPSRIPAGRLR